MSELAASRPGNVLSGVAKRRDGRREAVSRPERSPTPEVPLTEEEARLALRLRAHFNALAKRSGRSAAAPVARVEPANPAGEDAGVEELAIPHDLDEVAVPPPLGAVAFADENSQDTTDTNDEDAGDAGYGRKPAPVWLSSRRRSTWREWAGAVLSWMTTFAIVTTILGCAIIGLIGYGRAAALAGAAVGRAMELGRLIGLFGAI